MPQRRIVCPPPLRALQCREPGGLPGQLVLVLKASGWRRLWSGCLLAWGAFPQGQWAHPAHARLHEGSWKNGVGAGMIVLSSTLAEVHCGVSGTSAHAFWGTLNGSSPKTEAAGNVNDQLVKGCLYHLNCSYVPEMADRCLSPFEDQGPCA